MSSSLLSSCLIKSFVSSGATEDELGAGRMERGLKAEALQEVNSERAQKKLRSIIEITVK